MSGKHGEHLRLAIQKGWVKHKPADLYSHLKPVYDAVILCRGVGWHQWGMNVPVIEIKAAYEAGEFCEDFGYFAQLFRLFERQINERRDSESNRDKD